MEKSIDYFRRAIAIEERFALAYAALSDSYHFLRMAGGLSPKEAYSKAREAALAAVPSTPR